MNARTIALFALCATSCARAQGPPGNGVLVIAVDALRADHLPAWGYDRQTTTFLDELASEGVTFTGAWASGSGIVPGHVALLTGCDPLIAKVPAFRRPDGTPVAPLVSWKIPETVPRIGVEFLANGYTTAAFVDHPLIGGLRGFDQGFVVWEDFGGGRSAEVFEFGLRGVGGRFLDWLEDREADEDWFAYIHMNDLERTWRAAEEEIPQRFSPRPELEVLPPLGEGEPIYFALPPSRYTGEARTFGELEAQYDSAVEHLDRNINRLFSRVKKLGRWERTTVVVVGSFGVGLGDSGLITMSGTLSDADLHVPLIVRPNRALGIEPAQFIDVTVSTIDLAPSLLALAGIATPPGMHGTSLVPAMRGGSVGPRRYAFASCYLHDGFAVIDERYCFERSYPASRGTGTLSSSWFGDELPHRGEFHEFLHDRFENHAAGHIHGTADTPEASAAMRRAGEEWYELIDRGRQVLHRSGWDDEEPAAQEVRELVERGILAPGS